MSFQGRADTARAPEGVTSDAPRPVTARTEPRTEPLDRWLEAERALAARPITSGNAVTLLNDGKEAYESMFSAFAAAQEQLLVETYMLEDDEIGGRLSDALVAAARRGVLTRLLYDDVGSQGLAEDFRRELEASGVEVRTARSLESFSLHALLGHHRRNHRKISVVDGRIGFTGGVNFCASYTSSGSKRSRRRAGALRPDWRDTHLRIEGPAAAELHAVFLADWRAAGRGEANARIPPVPEAARRPGSAGNAHVRIALTVGGDEGPEQIQASYENAIARARHRVWITNAYFAPHHRLRKRLRDAARRGVDVRVVVAGETDSSLAFHASRSVFGTLLRAGARIWQQRDTMLHAKTAVIDGCWCTVGSANLDCRSRFHNDEANAIVLDGDLGAEMEALFLDGAGSRDEIEPGRWRRRSTGRRLMEHGAKLVYRWI